MDWQFKMVTVWLLLLWKPDNFRSVSAGPPTLVFFSGVLNDSDMFFKK